MTNKEIKAIHTRCIINNLPRVFSRAQYNFMHDTSDSLGYCLDSAVKNGFVYPCAFEVFDALDEDGCVEKRMRYFYTAERVNDDYIVYTEIINRDTVERWYYGTYTTADRANAVALSLGSSPLERTYHCVIRASEARAFGVRNLPI